jgi:hypothetical protein
MPTLFDYYFIYYLSMSTISTISELLTLSGSQYRVFDIGRKIDKLSKETFTKIEANQIPYPFPSQRHAFIAISFWQKPNSSLYLWFVKLPLDERGLLNLVARDHFIAIIIEALGAELNTSPNEQQEELLKSNPYHFTPPQYKLAYLNSLISVETKNKSSQYFSGALGYLSGDNAWQDWQSVGVQGLNDFAVRLSDKKMQKILVNALPHLPKPVLHPLCSALENVKLPVEVIDVLIARFENLVTDKETNQTTVLSFLLRSLASSFQHPHVVRFINALIEQPSPEASMSEEIAIVITGRCWQVFNNEQQIMIFFELLVDQQELEVFQAIFKDLVAIPALRPLIFQCMRSPKRSQALSKAIGLLFQR